MHEVVACCLCRLNDCPQHHVRQSAQIAAPQSAHSAFQIRIQNGCVFSSGWILFTLPFASCAFNIRSTLSFEIPARAEISDNSFGLPCGVTDKTFSGFDRIFTLHVVDAEQCNIVLRLFLGEEACTA